MPESLTQLKAIKALFIKVTLTVALIIVAVLMAFDLVAKAATPDAQPAPPTVAPCQIVNTFGTIEIARCEPENGLPYYVNSVGFMLFEEW